jgi:hypothetical protein
MLFGVAALSMLCCLLIDGRSSLPRAGWGPPSRARLPWALSAVLVTLASYPLLLALPRLLRPRALLVGDAATHLAVALSIASHGLPHGWIETFDGGFPAAVHYPLVGWAAVAALARAGVPGATGQQALAAIATLGAPLAALLAARAAGARPFAAVAGALFVAWLSPFQSFEGGWEPYFAQGLFSQALAWPLVVALAWAIASRAPRARAAAPIAGALLAAAHPQIAIGAMAVVFFGTIASGNRDALGRYARAAVASAAVAAAEFAPGVRTLAVPFGWPPMEEWRQTGFAPDRVIAWALDGSLLDDGRAPVLSVAWLLSCAVLVGFSRRAACRAALAAMVAAAALTLGGRAIGGAGALGAALLAFLQPLRVLPMVPFAAAMCVAVAIEELSASAAAVLRRLPSGRPFDQLLALAPWLSLAPAAALALPVRAAWMRDRMALEGPTPSGGECGDAQGPARIAQVSPWLQGLDRGRLEFQTTERGASCGFARGVLLDSPLPLAGSLGVGAHVGVNSIAFSHLRPAEPGAAARAETLGVRFVVHPEATAPQPPGGWALRASGGGQALSERLGGTDLIGVGCARAALSGSDAALRGALFDDLASGASMLGDPLSLTVLETVRDPAARAASRRPVSDDGCSTQGAVVTERRREPGAYEAVVDAPSPVDVVIRASAYPTWRVSVDGAPAPVRVVAPGFPSVRLAAGRHRVEAVASLPTGYLAGVALALVVVLAAARGSPLSPPPWLAALLRRGLRRLPPAPRPG